MLDETIVKCLDAFYEDFSQHYRGSDVGRGIGVPLNNVEDILLFRSCKPTKSFSKYYNLADILKPNDYLTGITDMMTGVRFALNNNEGYDEYKSYSHSLGVALLKYRAKTLRLLHCTNNTVTLEIEASCFSWVELPSGDRYFYIYEYVDIPIKYLLSEDYCKKAIYEALYSDMIKNGMYTIDYVESIKIVSFVLDVSTASKNKLSDACYRFSQTALKPVVSYKTDSEVIVYNTSDVLCFQSIYIDDIEFLDLIKLYYLYSVNGLKHYETVKNYICSTVDDEDYLEAFTQIESHMTKNLEYEKSFYQAWYKSRFRWFDSLAKQVDRFILGEKAKLIFQGLNV